MSSVTRMAVGTTRFGSVISHRYQRGSIVLTTNLAVGTWGHIFDDAMVAAAMLDRLLHRSIVFFTKGTQTVIA